MIKSCHVLYNIDSAGRTRIWKLEYQGNQFRAVSGLKDGKLTTSKWTVCSPKNVGKENETTGEQQCQAEIKALYTKKKSQKYYDTENGAAGFKFFAPMLAKKWSDRKDKVEFPVFCQPKLDGYRCSIAKDEALSRGGKPFKTIGHVLDTLQKLFDQNPHVRFDGELYNHKFHNDFNTLGSLIKKQKPTAEDLENARQNVQYHVYDLPSAAGDFEQRFSQLTFLFEQYKLMNNPYVKLVPTRKVVSEEQLDVQYAQYLEWGFEGQMIRTIDLPYENIRSSSLLKRKEFFDEEFEVVSLEEGKGNWAGCAKAVYFLMPDERKTKGGENPRASIKGTQEFCRLLLEGELPKTTTVRFPNKTPDGIPRFPIAVEFQDKEGRVY